MKRSASGCFVILLCTPIVEFPEEFRDIEMDADDFGMPTDGCFDLITHKFHLSVLRNIPLKKVLFLPLLYDMKQCEAYHI